MNYCEEDGLHAIKLMQGFPTFCCPYPFFGLGCSYTPLIFRIINLPFLDIIPYTFPLCVDLIQNTCESSSTVQILFFKIKFIVSFITNLMRLLLLHYH